MPTLATGTSTNSVLGTAERGFTLLETLVTLVLIGIIASFTVLSVRGTSAANPAAAEVERLTALLELHRQEAVLRGEERGLRFTAKGYEVLTLAENGTWQSPGDSTLRSAHQLPDGLPLKLWIDGQRVDFDKMPAGLPQVLLLSSGETTPFQLVVGERGDGLPRYQLRGDIAGRLQAESLP